MVKDKTTKKKWPDRAIDFFANKDNKVWGAIFVPFIVCFKHKVEFFLWGMFVVVAGQLGTIINVVNRTLFQNPDWSFAQALYPDSVFGSFYTYALVLIASLIAPLFTRIKNGKEPQFRSMTIVFTTLLIFCLLLCAVFFSFASQEIRSVRYEDFAPLKMCVDVKQLIFFLLSIFFAWYAFGLSLMAQNNEGKEWNDDRYLEKEQEKVEEIDEKSTDVTNDGKDTAL